MSVCLFYKITEKRNQLISNIEKLQPHIFLHTLPLAGREPCNPCQFPGSQASALMSERHPPPGSLQARARSPAVVLSGKASIEAAASKLSRRGKGDPGETWVIDPRKSSWLGYWDATTSLALVYTAAVTPYEVALLEASLNALFVVNRCVDSIFAIDVLLQFVVMKEKDLPQASLGKVWVKNRGTLARDYLRSWFVLDVSTVAISALDMYTVGIGDDSGVLDSIAPLKALRVLRLLKLVRLVRSSRIFQRWETQIAIDYAVLSIAKCFFVVIVASHWIACIWLLQAFVVSPTPLPSWLGDDGYCIEAADTARGYVCQPPSNLYAASFYWVRLARSNHCPIP